ncbi:fibronectin type III domain-containing protein [Winogradskyella endarachnes]|uniref:T9SS type A sorting domain-containing protein n=1 Tax=Winogradskyella endarachnes TaxID=2681965 RepID=A0A6L6U7G9_9FLAO|nr:fibronectin type III domain-containing protein [Winogradskyella endarachnes]MUU76852.1 T9SS type A sorting domain-containing protein [Winogradskyella endarachnes]
MRKITLLLLTMVVSTISWSQCIVGTSYGSESDPNDGSVTGISTCTYAGEYNTITNVNVGDDYVFTNTLSGVDNYVTITDAADSVIAHGMSPLTVTAITSTEVRLHVTIDAACTTDSSCHTTTVQNTTVAMNSCPEPSNVTVSNLTDSSADLSWDDNGFATVDFNVEVYLLGESAAGGNTPVFSNSNVVGTSLSLSGLTESTDYDVYITAACSGATSNSNIVGPISFATTASCAEVSAIMVSNITITEADITWTIGTGNDSALVEVYLAGESAANGDTPVYSNPSASAGSDMALGLTGTTAYDVYVTGLCGGSSSNVAVGPVTFTTDCNAFMAPYTQDFETASLPTCWEDTGAEDWDYDNDGGDHVGDGGTITGSTASGGYYAFVNASGTDADAILNSPFVDITTLSAPSLSFYLISDAEDSDNSQLDVEVWDGAAWNNVGTYNTNTSGWELKIIDLSGLTITGYVQARFTVTEPTPADYDDDIAIDDVTFDEAPSCFAPSDLTAASITDTSAVLSWVDNAGASAWNVEVYEVAGGSLVYNGTGLTSNTVTISDLSSLTEYEFYIQADCGGGDASSWVGPITFTTTCSTFVAPYTQDFENGGSIPDCWEDTGAEPWIYDDNGGGHVGNNGTITGTTTSQGYYTYVDASGTQADAVLTSPFVDVSGLMVPSLTFYLISDAEDSANSQLDVEVWDGAAWNNVGIYNTNTSGWELQIIDLSGLTITGDVRARFTVTEPTPGDFDDDIAIDDVTFDELPSCSAPVATFTVVEDCTVGFSVDIDVTDLGSGMSYDVQSDGVSVGTITATGVTTVGPFTNDVEIDLLIVHPDDTLCSLSESGLVNPNICPIYVTCGTPSNINGVCYSSGVNEEWLFTSTDGVSLLNITVNAGQVESGWDEFIVYDGADATATELYNGYGNSGDLTGLTFNSTGTSLFIQITPDGSVDCGTSGYTNLDFDVNCLTCDAPVATFTVVEDCTAGFSVDIDVTDLGSGASYDVQSDGVSVGTITTTGVTTVGPFTNDVAVDLLLVHPDDSVCDVLETGLVNPNLCPTIVTCGTPSNVSGVCYTSGVTEEWLFTSADGVSSLNITVNAGQVENSWDEFIVYDGADATATELYNGYGNSGDLTGLTFNSTGSSLFIQITPDGSVDCGTEGYTNLDFDVSCSQDLSTTGFDNETAFSYFPNPVKNTLTLNAQNTIEHVAMYNMLGQEVLRATPNAIDSELDMSQLQSGAYFVKVTIANSIQTIKVIKQ